MDALTVALIGGLLGGAAAAVIGGLITLTVQRREHEARVAETRERHAHERALAREQRLQDRRARAYEWALEHAYRLGT